MVNSSYHRAFSLLEVLIVVGVVGILAAIGVISIGGLTEKAREEKLYSDVITLNRAVKVYLASGGSIDSSATAENVLASLRTKLSSAQAKRSAGLSSSFVDARVNIRRQSAAEAASGKMRVYWNSTKSAFELAASGSSEGIREFFLDDTIAENDGGAEDRSFAVQYADTGNWIWEYSDASGTSSTASITTIPVSSAPPNATPAGSPSSGPTGSPLPSSALLAPQFSLPGGDYTISNFDLMLSLVDPNSSGTSQVFYQVDFGMWEPYSGSVSILPGSIICAQAIAIDDAYQNSPRGCESYQALPATLAPPVIETSADAFGLFTDQTISFEIVNSNPPGISEIRYRINAGGWIDYSGNFMLDGNLYPSGVSIEAQVVSIDSPYYLPSMVSDRLVNTNSIALSGSASGSFHSPTGHNSMVTNLAGGGSSSHFEWGKAPSSNFSASTLDFNGTGFSDVASGERFQIGGLDYYNGTVLEKTGADTVDLSIGLSVDINGNNYNPYFDFSFDLINSINLGDPQNLWPDADYVRVNDARSSRTLVVDGYEFEFRIELSDSTSNGFSYFDEFHVLENKDASVNVYGTFVSLGPITADPSIVLGQNGAYVDAQEAVFLAVNEAIAAEGSARLSTAEATRALDGAAQAAKQAANALQSATDALSYADAKSYAVYSRDAADRAALEAVRAGDAAGDALAANLLARDAADRAIVLAGNDEAAIFSSGLAEDIAAQALETSILADQIASSAKQWAFRADEYASLAESIATPSIIVVDPVPDDD